MIQRAIGNGSDKRPLNEVVVPVLDLKNKQIVQAFRGDREHYRPICSPLVAGSDPLRIAQAIVEESGCRHFYLADLDSLENRQPPDLEVCRQLVTLGLTLWVDADWSRVQVSSAEMTPALLDSIRPIVSSECLESPDQMPAVFQRLKDVDPLFGLDLVEGKPRFQGELAPSVLPVSLLDSARETGFRTAIVLDLAAVGARGGTHTIDLIRESRLEVPGIELVSGGGVRDVGDVTALWKAGCDHVLVATAIHEGRFRWVEDVDER